LTSTTFVSAGGKVILTIVGGITSIASTVALTGVLERYIKVAANVRTVETIAIRTAISTESISTSKAVVLALWICLTNGGDGKEHSKTHES
jgi:hypothetical protein